MAAAHWREVVAVDRGRAGGDRACRALSAIVFVSGDTMLGRYLGRDHLQQVELGCDLEQRAGVLGQLMHLPHVASHHAYLEPPGQSAGGFHPLAQGLQ